MLRPQHVEQVEPFVDDSCKLLLHFNGQSGTTQFIDSSNNPKVVTAYGNACLSNSHYRFGGTSGYFDGNGDYLTIPDSDDWSFGTRWTISAWVYFVTLPSSIAPIVEQLSSDDDFYQLRLTNISGSYKWQFRRYKSSSIDITLSSSARTISTGIWYNIVFERDDTVYTIYENGSNVLTTTDSTNWEDISSVLRIATYQGATPIYSNIYLDELAIWKGIAKPIGELYPQKRPYGYPIGGT